MAFQRCLFSFSSSFGDDRLLEHQCLRVSHAASIPSHSRLRFFAQELGPNEQNEAFQAVKLRQVLGCWGQDQTPTLSSRSIVQLKVASLAVGELRPISE